MVRVPRFGGSGATVSGSIGLVSGSIRVVSGSIKIVSGSIGWVSGIGSTIAVMVSGVWTVAGSGSGVVSGWALASSSGVWVSRF